MEHKSVGLVNKGKARGKIYKFISIAFYLTLPTNYRFSFICILNKLYNFLKLETNNKISLVIGIGRKKGAKFHLVKYKLMQYENVLRYVSKCACVYARVCGCLCVRSSAKGRVIMPEIVVYVHFTHIAPMLAFFIIVLTVLLDQLTWC